MKYSGFYLIATTLLLIGCEQNAAEIQSDPPQQEVSSMAEIANPPPNKSKANGDANRQSSPGVTIHAVSGPKQAGGALNVRFSIHSRGATPLSLTQDQLSLHIKNISTSDRFLADPVFGSDVSDPIEIASDQTVKFSVEALVDRFEGKKTWRDLPRGDYSVQVYVNSGKTRVHEHQWLGQTYSNAYTISLPLH